MEKSINSQFRPILRPDRPGNLAKSSQSSAFPVAPHSQNVAEIVAIGSILVIENDATSVKALQRLFACEGYEFRSTSNGKQGLEMFVCTRPDAVILDLLLPGLSGRDICRAMKQTSFDIPVIILSAISVRRGQSPPVGVWGRRLCDKTVQPPRTTCQGSGSHQTLKTVETSRTDSVRQHTDRFRFHAGDQKWQAGNVNCA